MWLIRNVLTELYKVYEPILWQALSSNIVEQLCWYIQ